MNLTAKDAIELMNCGAPGSQMRISALKQLADYRASHGYTQDGHMAGDYLKAGCETRNYHEVRQSRSNQQSTRLERVFVYDHRVESKIANQPPPKPPNVCGWRIEWLHYWEDLACWKAMKADCLLFGVKE